MTDPLAEVHCTQKEVRLWVESASVLNFNRNPKKMKGIFRNFLILESLGSLGLLP